MMGYHFFIKIPNFANIYNPVQIGISRPYLRIFLSRGLLVHLA